MDRVSLVIASVVVCLCVHKGDDLTFKILVTYILTIETFTEFKNKSLFP